MTAKKTRRVTTIVALALVICLAIGGTIAWLTDTTSEITNTFTVGKVKITLTETTTGDTSDGKYKVVPGGKSAKDPVLTVLKESEDCYAFVLVENNLVNNNTVVGTPNIDTTKWLSVATSGNKTLYKYYQVVPANASSDQALPVFTEVAYANTLTAEQLTALNGATITLKGFAIQSDNISADEALAQAKTALGIA
jgi:predicted ribosomally synthesized peptide with SipW-like signal peptide